MLEIVLGAYPCRRKSSAKPFERAASGPPRGVLLVSINMKSPRFDVKEETLPALSPKIMPTRRNKRKDIQKLTVLPRHNPDIGIMRLMPTSA